MSASFPTRLRIPTDAQNLSGDGREPTASLPTHSEDARLMARVQVRNHEALAELFDRYSRMVFQIACQVLRDGGEAEELVQEVFLNVYRKCGSFDCNRGSVRGWLRRIAYREAFDRRNYLNSRRFYDSQAVDEIVEEIKSVIDIEQETDARRLESLLRSATDDLSQKQRSTLQMCIFGGYTLREISELQQDSLINTRHYYYRALARLRKAVPFRALKRKSRPL
jgi:RNA polymerase sigma-70 factor (ECF subfamily)